MIACKELVKADKHYDGRNPADRLTKQPSYDRHPADRVNNILFDRKTQSSNYLDYVKLFTEILGAAGSNENYCEKARHSYSWQKYE